MTTRRGRGRGRAIVAVAAVAGLATVAGCNGTEAISGPDGPGTVELGDIRLISHSSCDDLLDWFHTEAAGRVGPYGLGGPDAYPGAMRGAMEDSSSTMAGASTSAPTAAAPDSSSGSTGTSATNTQEPGVGEPDLTWTDGTRLVTIVNQRLQVVDLGAAAVTADLDLSADDASTTPSGLLVDGDHALVLQTTYPTYAYDEVARGGTASDRSMMPTPTEAATVLTRVDLGATPAVVGSVSVQGSLVDARMVDGVVRTVVRSSPADIGFVYPSGNGRAAIERATQVNQGMVAESTIDDWLPSMTVAVDGDEPSTSPAVDCTAVDHPAEFGGFSVVTVVGLDLGAGAVDPLPGAAVVADAQTVYSSSDALYVATTRYPAAYPTYSPDGATTSTAPTQATTVSTDVHAFSLPTDAAARYEASGSVPGTLIGQFALSEHDGDLRVATTVPPAWASGGMPIEDGVTTGATAVVPAVSPEPTTSESRITVLRPDGDVLGRVGEVTGLGPTEQIRGVRFAGPTAYVVTFRQTDPLYVVDLSDPTAPTVAGELKIPGYSSYLQVLDEGRVLGIGQDATDRGRATGLQESLFDVSDPTSPTRTGQLVIPGAYSTAENDHHALLWWPDTDLLAVPVQLFGSNGGLPFEGVVVTRVTDGDIATVGTITHPPTDGAYAVPACPAGASCIQGGPTPYPTPIARTLVAGGKLVTVSTAGVKVSDLTSLADVSWTSLA